MDWPAALAAHPRFGGLSRSPRGTSSRPTARPSGACSAPTASSTCCRPERRSELIEEAVAVADAQGAFDADGSGAIPWRCELFVLRRT